MAEPDYDVDEDIRLVKSVTEAYNAHDVDRRSEFMADRITLYSPTNPMGLKGREACSEDMRSDIAGFPDIQLRAERVIGNPEWVLVQGVLSGTNNGPLRSPKGKAVRATKKRIEIRYAQIYRLEAGKITEVHDYFDRAQLAGQLGLAKRNRKTGFYFMILIIWGLIQMTVSGLIFLQNSETVPSGPLATLFYGGIWLIAASVFFLARWILSYGRGS